MSKIQCIACGDFRPADEYSNPEGTKKNQKCHECKRKLARIREKNRVRNESYHERHRLRSRFNTLKRRGVIFESKDQFLTLVAQEKQGCEICGSTDRMCIDHNHSTGKPRGVLCEGCNQGIGNFGESADKMLKAIVYLKRVNE